MALTDASLLPPLDGDGCEERGADPCPPRGTGSHCPMAPSCMGHPCLEQTRDLPPAGTHEAAGPAELPLPGSSGGYHQAWHQEVTAAPDTAPALALPSGLPGRKELLMLTLPRAVTQPPAITPSPYPSRALIQGEAQTPHVGGGSACPQPRRGTKANVTRCCCCCG